MQSSASVGGLDKTGVFDTPVFPRPGPPPFALPTVAACDRLSADQPAVRLEG
jgi:hypothetical protein